jgi:hypothetical protein
MAPYGSFTHCRYSIKHEKDTDSNKAFLVENGRKRIYMKESHEAEGTKDTERTCDYNRYSIFGKPVTERSIG